MLLIITITNSSHIIGEFAASFFTNHFVQYYCNQTVGCNRTSVIRQLKQPIILSPLIASPLITEMTKTVIDSNNHLSKEKLGNFQNEGILTKDIVSTGDIFSRCICLFRN